MSGRRILFAGTPDFALASLRALCENDMLPIAVYTQPDRPAGRGKKLTPSPVKQFALTRGIEVRQPESLKDADVVKEIGAFRAQIMVVAAYGLILPQAILDLPERGCLNVHASLLPRWRGAAPVQAAILAGDRETGISLMQMTTGLDSGPVYAQQSLEIGDTETAGELSARLASLGADALCKHLGEILDGGLEAIPQDDELATYARKIRKGDAAMDWRSSASELARQVRAYSPEPGAYFAFDGERVKCWAAAATEGQRTPVGAVIAAGRDGIDVACGQGVLRMFEVQRPGRRRIRAREFADQTSIAGKRLG